MMCPPEGASRAARPGAGPFDGAHLATTKWRPPVPRPRSTAVMLSSTSSPSRHGPVSCGKANACSGSPPSDVITTRCCAPPRCRRRSSTRAPGEMHRAYPRTILRATAIEQPRQHLEVGHRERLVGGVDADHPAAEGEGRARPARRRCSRRCRHPSRRCAAQDRRRGTPPPSASLTDRPRQRGNRRIRGSTSISTSPPSSAATRRMVASICSRTARHGRGR